MHLTDAGHDIPTSTRTTTRESECFAVFASGAHLTSARVNAPSAPGPIAPPRRKSKPVIKTQLGKQLSKSPSTPQLRGPAMSDSEDKSKRNKLGYQRISIACAHCRRRKIRCLLSEDENEQRCQNCIRLKKECVFYPVDQQAAMDARSEASGKTGGPSASSTVPSSPSQMGVRPLDHPGSQFGTGYPGVPSDGSRGFQGIPIVPTINIPPQGSFAHPDHGYQSRAGETAVAWSPQEFGTQSPAVAIGDPTHMPQHFARYGHSNMTVDTAPFPGSIEPTQPNFDQYGFSAGQIPQPQWQPPQQQHHHQPVRSMSYPNNFADQMYSPPLNHGQHAGAYVQSFQQHQADPHIVAMAPVQGTYVGSPTTYMLPSDQRSTSIPNPSPFPPPQWYTSAPPYTPTSQEMRTLPSQNEEYSSRPG